MNSSKIDRLYPPAPHPSPLNVGHDHDHDRISPPHDPHQEKNNAIDSMFDDSDVEEDIDIGLEWAVSMCSSRSSSSSFLRSTQRKDSSLEGGDGGRVGGGGGIAKGVVRDLEGETRAVAAKLSELIRQKDLVEAMKVFRAVQVVH